MMPNVKIPQNNQPQRSAGEEGICQRLGEKEFYALRRNDW